MKSFVSIVFACGAVAALSVLAACGDDSDDGGSGGGAGMTTGGASGSGGGKASGGASSGGASSGGASSGGASSGGASSGGASTGGASSGGTGGGGSGDHAVCADAQSLADEQQSTLNCPNGTGMVQEECEMILAAVPDCEDELEAAQACAEGEPAASWECDADDEVSLMENVCSEEATALILCALM